MLLDDKDPETVGVSFPRSRPSLLISFSKVGLELDLLCPEGEPARKTFRQVLSGEQPSTIPEILDHLLYYSKKGSIGIKFNLPKLQDYLAESRRDRLEKLLCTPGFGVCHPGMFLLPSGYYAEHFYQVSSMFENDDSRTILREALWSAYERCTEEGVLLICLSSVGCEAGRLLASHPSFGSRNDQVFYFPSLEELIGFRVPENHNHGLTILVDVIATGSALGTAAKMLSRGFDCSNIAALSILDVRAAGVSAGDFIFQDLKIPLTSLIRKQETLHAEKPHLWPFSEIIRIDPRFWRPTVDDFNPQDVWSGRNFIQTACVESDSIRIGHYSAKNGNHFRFFILTKNIVAVYRDHIIEQISRRIDTTLQVARISFISYIFYPADSFGVPEIAAKLAALHGGARLIPLDRDKDARSYSIIPNIHSAALILYSACSSNRTVWLLLDAAARAKAGIVIGCIMMSRAPQTSWRIITLINGYSNSAVNIFALTRIELPVFSSKSECPLCRRARILAEIEKSKRYSPLHGEILRQLQLLRETPIRAV